MNNKNALIIGIRDEESVCYAIASEIKRAGYNLYASYQDDSTYDSVKRIAEDLGIKKIFPYDARKDTDLDAFTKAMKEARILEASTNHAGIARCNQLGISRNGIRYRHKIGKQTSVSIGHRKIALMLFDNRNQELRGQLQVSFFVFPQ